MNAAICTHFSEINTCYRQYGNKSGISFTYQSSNVKEFAFSLHFSCKEMGESLT